MNNMNYSRTYDNLWYTLNIFCASTLGAFEWFITHVLSFM